MGNIYSFLLFAMVLIGSCCEASADCEGLVGEFMRALDRGPTVFDSQRFAGIEDELQFELMICEEKNLSHDDCVAFTRSRGANQSSSRSFYLSWLKTKIPMNAEVQIHKIQNDFLDEYPYQRIVTKVDGKNVVFGCDKKHGPFGLLFIVSIDGVSPATILERDIAEGFSPVIFLEGVSLK